MAHIKELQIWQRSKQFCSHVYEATSKFPDAEKFGLTNQIRRASVSIPSNIAEGSSRISNKDFSRFLQISIGSAYEIETQLLIANDLGFIQQEEKEFLLKELGEIIMMISKFKSKLTI